LMLGGRADVEGIHKLYLPPRQARRAFAKGSCL
jgi:hypothetical protein